MIASLTHALRRQRPDIVHFFLPEAYLLGGLAAKLARIPYRVMSRRSQNLYQARYPRYAALERRLHARMDAVLGNSPQVCAELATEGVPLSRLGMIANGLDTVRFTPGDKVAARRALALDKAPLVFVVVANLIAYKGHADLIDALSSIHERLPAGWMLLCVGRDGGQETDLRARADAAGIAAHIRWAGEQADVLPWLQAADIALLASHEEGSPNSLIEAMACGLPVVATDVGGVGAIVDDGGTGYLVPPRAPDQLAARLFELATEPGRREDMARSARDTILQHSEIERCIDDYANLYDALMIRPAEGVPAALLPPES